MKISSVKTHIVDSLIPEEHRVRSGAGSRPAFGLVTEVIPDRTSTSLA